MFEHGGVRARPVPIQLMVLLACVACDGPVARDAEVDSGAGGVAPPMLPTPPTSLAVECPSGWGRRALSDGVSVCWPWEHERPSCPASQTAFVGAVCRAVGSACPATDFPVEAVDGVFVIEGAVGDGTRASPMGSIVEALAIAGSRTVWVGAGSYDEAITLGTSQSVRGVCPARVEITAPETEDAVRVAGGDAALRDVRIAGGREGIDVQPGATVALVGVEITGVHRAALAHSNSTIELDDVWGHDLSGYGVEIGAGAVARLHSVVFDRVGGSGVIVNRGGAVASDPPPLRDTEVELADLVIDGVHPTGPGGPRGGIVTLRETTPLSLTVTRALRARRPRPRRLLGGEPSDAQRHRNRTGRAFEHRGDRVRRRGADRSCDRAGIRGGVHPRRWSSG